MPRDYGFASHGDERDRIVRTGFGQRCHWPSVARNILAGHTEPTTMRCVRVKTEARMISSLRPCSPMSRTIPLEVIGEETHMGMLRHQGVLQGLEKSLEVGQFHAGTAMEISHQTYGINFENYSKSGENSPSWPT